MKFSTGYADTTNTVVEFRPARATAVIVLTIGMAAVGWFVTVRRMSGMDMGPTTSLGSFSFFLGVWTPMMAAMMLPSALPAVVSFDRWRRGPLAAPVFVGCYLTVWAAFGMVAYLIYREHSAHAAGVAVICAGLYELTPIKRACRRRCQLATSSGVEYAAYCVGSSVGFMVVLLALGVMSITWMVVVGGIVLVQKVLPLNATLDRIFAVALVVFGLWVALAPSSVPALT